MQKKMKDFFLELNEPCLPRISKVDVLIGKGFSLFTKEGQPTDDIDKAFKRGGLVLMARKKVIKASLKPLKNVEPKRDVIIGKTKTQPKKVVKK